MKLKRDNIGGPFKQRVKMKGRQTAMSIGKPKIVECPERRNNVSDRYTDERLSKFLTNDKRAR